MGKPTPAQIETEGITTADVEWRGHLFTVPASADDWPAEATLAFEEGHPTIAIRAILGPKQFAAFMAGKPRNRDISALFDSLARDLGLGSAGE